MPPAEVSLLGLMQRKYCICCINCKNGANTIHDGRQNYKKYIYYQNEKQEMSQKDGQQSPFWKRDVICYHTDKPKKITLNDFVSLLKQTWTDILNIRWLLQDIHYQSKSVWDIICHKSDPQTIFLDLYSPKYINSGQND